MERADPPGFSLRLERDDYDVVGSTLSQLRACSALLGPSPDGRRHAAYTRWEIRWRYEHRLMEGRWSAVDVRVTAVVTRTLPRWSPVRSAEPSLAVEWARYLEALTLHEQGHLLIAAEAGRAVHEALLALAPCETREALDALAGETARAITARHRDEERAYDALTDHGATQGCV